VAACNHLECSFAVPARKRITESLARGETGEQILADFKGEYGEKVLSSPVPEGFNILAWVGPYLGIFIAGSLMFAFFRRRAGETPIASAPQSQDTPPPTDERLARLQHEVEDLER
jgi:cytochrome c-type biogenesis protein CcmH